MAATKACRVCGKQYKACRTANKLDGVFHWQEVACSPECGAEYLRKVTEARNPAPTVVRKSKKHSEPVLEAAIEEVNDSVEEGIVLFEDIDETL